MQTLSLSGPWEGRCISPDGASFSFASQVPGSSLADLIRAGHLPKDLFFRNRADAVEAFEKCDFEYSRSFSFSPSPDMRYTLSFEKLDTYCDIYLNDILLASCQNEHIPHEADATPYLHSGENHLRLYFHSPIVRTQDLPARPAAFTFERLYTRRTQCTFGWDWVARLISCGIGGEVKLLGVLPDETQLEHLYVYTKNVDEDSAQLGIDLHFGQTPPRRVLTLCIFSPDGSLCRRVQRFCAEADTRITLDIPSPALWYPLGYGAQPLYTLTLLDGETSVFSQTFGIRTVKILQLPDDPDGENAKKCREIQNPHYDENEEFSGFILKVNGKKILCKGANWVPCEPFCQGSTDEKITRLLETAAESGLNMIRIWGGGTFESAHFYRECSRLGLMVTQDFLMACGHYPEEEEWFLESLRAEARYAALHMRNEPCLMWWSGDNENAVEGCDQDKDYWGRRSALWAIAPVLHELDPHRAFLPSSPYGGKKYASNTVGTTHNTQFLGSDILPYMLGGNCDDYKEVWKSFRARFIAEEPQLGAASLGTLRRFMTDEDIFGADDSMWKYHTKSNPALSRELYDISLDFAQSLFGPFTSGEDRCFKLRYLQYEWVRLSMEQLRREMWFSSGLIYWMLNDCWPAASGWSLIDYYEKPKDGYYAFKRCAKQTVLSFEKEKDSIRLFVSNEGEKLQNVQIQCLIVNKTQSRLSKACTICLPAASTVPALQLTDELHDGDVLIAHLSAPGVWDRTFYRQGALPLIPCRVEMNCELEHNRVTLTAWQYVHAVELEGNAVFEDNCFSLLPGESRTISFRPLGSMEEGLSVQAYTIR